MKNSSFHSNMNDLDPSPQLSHLHRICSAQRDNPLLPLNWMTCEVGEFVSRGESLTGHTRVAHAAAQWRTV